MKRHNIQKCAFPFPDKIDPLLVDVYENVDLSNQDLTGISFKFRKVDGDFDCSNCNLTSLDFAPEFVGGDFDCSNNQLTSLKDCPKEVKGYLNCINNRNLKSLKGIKKVKGQIYSDFFEGKIENYDKKN